MDPRLDVRGRIAELLASAPPTSDAPRGGRFRTVVGGALISAGRTLAGDPGTREQGVARR